MKFVGIAGVLVLLTLGLGWAANPPMALSVGWPSLPVIFAAIYLVQWLGFLHAWYHKTEHFYDLIGSCSFICAVAAALWLGEGGPLPLLLGAMVAVWALRLGSFLFLRVREVGEDQRFRQLKHLPARFFLVWNLQGLWVSLTCAAALTVILSGTSAPLTPLSWFGFGLWCIGFGFEAYADHQKTVFRRDGANHGKFIATGLWSLSQHPNYFGEILLWAGVTIAALPAMVGGQLLTLISPLFVVVLLTRISGIPTLVQKAKRQWGDDPDYQAYVKSTPILIPNLLKR